MRRVVTVIVLFTLVLLTAIPVLAGTEVKFDAQVRARSQYDDKSFDTANSENSFSELRTRLGMSATVDDNAHLYIQLQDSRIIGDNNQFDMPSSGTLNDGKNIDLHQGYIKIDNIFGKGWGGQAGRFEFVKGNQRFLGDVGWSNVGRSWEGSMMWYKKENFQITGFMFNAIEMMDTTYNRDTDILGLYAEINKINLDLFAVLEDKSDTNGFATDINSLERFNVGTYYHRTHNQFDFEMNGVYQFGTMPSSDIYTYIDSMDAWEMDLSAFMFNFESGFTFNCKRHTRLAIGADYSSGNDFKDSTKYKAYTNSYYTGHKFRGYMDYFAGSDPSGLIDLMFKVKMNPGQGWTINGDFHYFTTAQDYISDIDGTTKSKDVGTEFDFTVSTTRVAGVNLVGGVSVFLPKDNWLGTTEHDRGVWTYTMATVNVN